jgi:hypothetical protein
MIYYTLIRKFREIFRKKKIREMLQVQVHYSPFITHYSPFPSYDSIAGSAGKYGWCQPCNVCVDNTNTLDKAACPSHCTLKFLLSENMLQTYTLDRAACPSHCTLRALRRETSDDPKLEFRWQYGYHHIPRSVFHAVFLYSYGIIRVNFT